MSNTSTSSDASSIVASVLNALQVKGTSTPKETSSLPASPMVSGRPSLGQNVSDYEQQEMMLADSISEVHGSNIVIGQSSGSAFTSLRMSNSSSCIKTPVQQREPKTVDSSSKKSGASGIQLTDHVGQVGKMFGQILRGLMTYASSLKESLQEVKEER